MHQNRGASFALTVTFLLTLFHVSLAAYNQSICSIKERPKINIELLIVCDKDFSDIFQQDRNKILDFWAVNLWDVNMRFKTLTSVDISFHLTSLITTNATGAQPFIEQARLSNGSIDLQEVIFKFGEWIHQNEKVLTNFDIAILVTGAHVPDNTTISWQFKNSVCKKHELLETHLSVATLSADVLFGSNCNTLERMLGRLLGAPWDSETEIYRDCKKNNYVMGKQSICDQNQFFFSECADAAIAFNANAKSSWCLWNTSSTLVDIIEDRANTATPPSLQEQCAILTNSSEATIVEDKNQCISTKCYVPVHGTRMYAKTLYPLDNTPCGNAKFCFRGRCLDRGYEIKNAKIGMCLHSSDRFASDDYVIMGPCMKSATPLDKFVLLDLGNGVIHLATPYSSPNADENTDKCLSVEIEKQSLRYRKCISENQEILEWHLVQGEYEGEFLLYHPLTKVCIYADENNFISVDTACFGSDSMFTWKFVDLPVVPDKWMKSADVITKKSRDTTTKSTILFNATNRLSLSNKFIKKSENLEENSQLAGWMINIVIILSGIMLGILIGFVVSHFFFRKQKPGTNVEPLNYENQYAVLYTSEST